MLCPRPAPQASPRRRHRRFWHDAARLRPLLLLAAAGLATPAAHAEFTITLNWGAGMQDKYKSYFTDAANVWQSYIFGYKDGVTLTGVTINATVAPIDGVGNTLGQANYSASTQQQGTTYATRGYMEFDSADVQGMIDKGNFGKVIEHEMGHVLGLGTLWDENGLINLNRTEYTGARGLEAWRDEFRQTSATFVPLEQGGGPGTNGSHWDEVDGGAGNTGITSKYTGRDMADELMTGWSSRNAFTSTLTLGSLMDLGYVIGLPRDANGDYVVTQGPYYGKMTGAHRLLKTTAERARIYGDNDITGGVIISAGILEVRHINALGKGPVLIQNGATLDTGAISLTGLTTLTLENGTLTGTTGSINAARFELISGTVEASLTGNGDVRKSGAGTVTIRSANTYAGGTTIAAGTVITANRDALSTGPVTVEKSGVLSLAADLSLGRLIVSGGEVRGTGGTLAAAQVELLAGTVAATLTGAGTVEKNGADTATLTGANTHTGGTRINAGQLRVTHAAALGAGEVTVTGGILDVGTTPVGGFTTLTLRGGQITGTTGTLEAGRVDLYAGEISAGLTGAGAVTKLGAGDATLAGPGTFTGGLTVREGRLLATGANALGAGLVRTEGTGAISIRHADAAALATVDLAGGAIEFGDTTAPLRAASIGTLMGDTGLALTNKTGDAFALTLGKNNASSTYAGAFSGAGSLPQSCTCTLTLTVDCAHSGFTPVVGVTLLLEDARALGAGPAAVTGGTLQLDSLNVTLARPFTLTDGLVQANEAGSLTAPAYLLQGGTVAVTLAGAGALVKSGAGEATLSVRGTYTGGTTVDAGTLKVNHHRGLGAGEVTVAGGTLTAEAAITGPAKLTLRSGLIDGFGSLKADAYDLRNGEVQLKLAGTAALEKNTDGTAGGGTVTLSAANTLSGAVRVNAGTLAITHAYALGKGVTTVNAGKLRVGNAAPGDADYDAGKPQEAVAFGALWEGAEIQLNAGAQLALNLASTTTVTRLISGAGGVVLNGGGTVTLANATYSGETVVNAGKLVLRGDAPLAGPIRTDGTGTVEFALAGAGANLPANLSGSGTVRLTGGRAGLNTTLAHTGAIAVGADAELTLGASGAPVALRNTLVRVEQGGRLSGNATVAGRLENAGTVAPGFSPGTITLTGDFVNAATGTLLMEVATDGTHDQIRYAGTAALAGTLQVAYLGTPPKGATVDLLVDTDTADGKPSVTGQFTRVITPDGTGVAYATGTGVNFIVGGTVFDLPGASSPRAGRLAGFANTLARAASGNTADAVRINAVTSTFANPGAALARTVTGASPLGLASATALPLTQTQGDNDLLHRHLTARRFERESAWQLDYSPYAYVNSASATADTGKDGRAFDHDSVGGSVGVDVEPARDLLIGAKIGYDAGNASFHEGGGKLAQNRLHVTVYGAQLYDTRYYAEAGAFGGYSLYDVKQNTVLGKNTGDTRGWDAGLFVTGGWIAPLTAKTSLTPHAGLALSHARVGAFAQRGNALALDVDGYAQTSLASRVGSGLNHVTKVGDLKMRFTLDAAWVHEWLDNEVDIEGSVSGAGFSTAAVALAKDHLEVGPEIAVGVSDNSSVSLAYKYDYAFGDATAHRLDVGYRTRF